MQNIKIFFEFLKESPKKPQKMSSRNEMWSKSKKKFSLLEAAQPKHL